MNPFAYDGIALSAPLQLTGCLYGFTCTSKKFHLAAAPLLLDLLVLC